MKLKFGSFLVGFSLFAFLLYQSPNHKVFFHLQAFILIALIPIALIIAMHGWVVLRVSQWTTVQRQKLLTSWNSVVLRMLLVSAGYALIHFFSGPMGLTSLGEPLALVLTSVFYAVILRTFFIGLLMRPKRDFIFIEHSK